MNTTKKFPRTITEAFGPYTDNRIYEPVEGMHKNDAIAVGACIIALVAALVTIFVWG
jgi:hypothetical protein